MSTFYLLFGLRGHLLKQVKHASKLASHEVTPESQTATYINFLEEVVVIKLAGIC